MNTKKLSKFNAILNNKRGCTIFNSFSSGLLSLNDEYTTYLNNIIEGNYNEIPQELLDNLVKGNMLVDKNIDELKLLQVIHNEHHFQNNSLNLTIAPTLSCNFACSYCYEEGRRYNSMTTEIEEKTMNFIDTHMFNKSSLSIVWYGGEPLLGIDTIERLTQKIIQNKYNFVASIVTNGYLLDIDMVNRLKKQNISHIQVTLDGPDYIHDNRRVLHNGKGTFSQIINNISVVFDIIPITIRVNVDKENIDSVADLLNTLDNYKLQNKISVYIAPVSNINNTCDSSTCFTEQDFAVKQIEFYKKFSDRGYFFVNIPRCNPEICGAISSSSFIIDPIGDLYKCWDDVGNKSEVIGNISDKKLYNANHLKWIGYDYTNNSECKDCPVLPICMSGCPNYVIKSKKPHCHHLRYNLNKYIELIYKLRSSNVI